jgi:uncharacterized protein YrzB (UPF0473 family)
MEDNKDYVTLFDEEENEYTYELVLRVEFNDFRYAVLVPVEEECQEDENENENDELVIMRIEEDEEQRHRKGNIEQRQPTRMIERIDNSESDIVDQIGIDCDVNEGQARCQPGLKP